jgi:IPT/TIG domain
MRCTITLLALLLAATLSADPVITSITPNVGPVAGGTRVIVKGTGFSTLCIVCSPVGFGATPMIYFLETEAASVKYIDSTTLEVVTPPHLPATVPVRVHQFDGSQPFTLENAFTFEGEPASGFDPILFPIFLPPVKGAFDSEFHTTARIWNEDLFHELTLYGVDTSCYLFDPPIYPLFPQPVAPNGLERTLLTGCSTTPGRLFWVPKGEDTIAANLRVRDVTRQATSHGVEIPVVHRNDFSTQRITLLGVPIEPRFRNTLRIYGVTQAEQLINVSIGNELHQLYLQRGADVFEPASLTFTDFPLPEELPAGQSTIKVVVDLPRGVGGVPLEGNPLIWAFITVTNNETQQITTITPN